MKLGKRTLDLPQAIVLAAMIIGALVAAALVLTWGPADSRAVIVEWGTGIGGVLGSIYLAFKGGLLTNDDGPGAGAVLLLLAAACAVAGCGGVPREARVAVETLATGVDRADVLVAARVRTQGEEARRQVLEEVVAGVLASVEAGEARFEELIASEAGAVDALRGARAALLTLEAAFDAWDAGADEGSFLEAAACAVVAVAALATALEAVGVVLPDELTSGLGFLEAFARGSCPTPATSGGESASLRPALGVS